MICLTIYVHFLSLDDVFQNVIIIQRRPKLVHLTLKLHLYLTTLNINPRDIEKELKFNETVKVTTDTKHQKH